MTRTRLAFTVFLSSVLLVPADTSAQVTNPLSAGAKAQFTGISSFVARSADKIPENLFAFRATPEVRTISQLFGHIADAYFAMAAPLRAASRRRGDSRNQPPRRPPW